MKRYKQFFWTAFIVTALDQLTKFLVVSNISFGAKGIGIVEGFFYITHARNTGAAWSQFSGYSFILGLLGVAVLFAMYFFRDKLELERIAAQYSMGLMAGGTSGNVIDRFYYGYVIDFIDIYLPGYHWPTFNIADIGITVGVALYIIFVVIFAKEKAYTQEKTTQNE